MATHEILVAGRWRAARSAATFQAENPALMRPMDDAYPISSWEDIDEALDAATAAAARLRQMPPEALARFLERYADAIETQRELLVATAHAETALPVQPRLADVELPRTTGQLRAAARAARDASWMLATIDTNLGIRSCHAALGPALVLGPNNFPFAFNSVSGGDFAAAIAAGNPVIAKANTSHPGTTRLLAVAADQAARQCELPDGTVQLLYRTSHADGERAVADARVGATAYTGSRAAGLALKAAADRAGKPIYLELSSVNPVILMSGAIEKRADQLAADFTTSCLMGAGQFCTNPGLVVLPSGGAADRFVGQLAERFRAAPVGTLLSRGVLQSLEASFQKLVSAGAKTIVGGTSGGGAGYSFANTLLRISGAQFLANPELCQTEAFGPVSLLVIADNVAQIANIVDHLEGNLTGSIYSDYDGSDDIMCGEISTRLRRHVGRLLNDKMPTGVAVSSAMNHGGPYPATGHPGFTAVGIPAALRRFSALECYDNVRPARLPAVLQDKNPTGQMWRLVDERWTQDDVRG